MIAASDNLDKLRAELAGNQDSIERWRYEIEAEQQAHWDRVKDYDVIGISRSAPNQEPAGAVNI